MAGAATTARSAPTSTAIRAAASTGTRSRGPAPLAGPRLRGQLQSPLHHARRRPARLRARRTICSAPTMRRSTGSRRTATTSPTSPASTPTGSGADYLKNYKAFISVGHDEYWSGDQRANVEEARDAGVNLLFWSGNEVYWKTRWEVAYQRRRHGLPHARLLQGDLADRRSQRRPGGLLQPRPDQHLDRHLAGHALPRQPARRRRQPAGRGPDHRPQPGLPLRREPAHRPAVRPRRHRPVRRRARRAGALRRPARLARHHRRQRRQLDIAPGILGYEWDTSPDDDLRPAGLIKLSETTLPWSGILVDQGNTTAPGVATHNLSLYRAESGALVFGAGTVFWSWALSNEHDSSPYGAKSRTSTSSSSRSTCSPTWASSRRSPTPS